MSPAELARVRAHPNFRAAAESMAAKALEHTAAQDEVSRELTKDIGRTSLYFATLILEAALGKVSAYDLMASAAANQTCSRGRVLAFIELARSAGRLRVGEGPGHWTKRPLVLTPAFREFGETRLWCEIEGSALVAPEAAEALLYRTHPRAAASALVMGGHVVTLQSERLRESGERMHMFLSRDAGMRVLHEWLCSQKPGRVHLLEAAPLNRSELSRRHRISRAHLNQLLADARSEGLLSTPSPDSVVFSPVLSDAVEQHFAVLIQLCRLNARAVLDACRPEGAHATSSA